MPLPRHHEPIVAIATAPGRGAVGIVRVSGQDLSALVLALCGRPLSPRHAHYGPFLAADGQAIDQGLAIHFPAPQSYTGEHVLELQAHGGPVVLQLLVARCLEAAAQIDAATGQPCLPHLRLAEPGEFTERAFLNDKIDLAQAEAVADLIEASTEAAARSAGRSLSGAFSREIDQLRERIVRLRMLVEATLDFPEEEIDFLEKADARGQLATIMATLASVLERARQGALLREGLQVVLAGQPNVGKSSLLNALAGAELAIVTPIPGTTRDKVSETLQINGVPLHVIDTAGLREQAQDEVERIGIARSWDAIRDADAVIFLHDLTRRGEPDYEVAEAAIAERLHIDEPQRILQVHNKADVVTAVQVPAGELALSARSGLGLDALRQALLERAGWHASPEGVFIARKRHVLALQRTREHLVAAADHAAVADAALDLFAEELRLGHDALAEITGAFTSDDLLGEIFSRFCIGK
ncbi:tRNA uridine-5-carboxymethylaminomethyl(34) synthesis GTPase MnmE [Aquabacterium sp.]|uniref:tRNA uridine-5-carboxymethylaminomethyl(34) synthesis GTPase MnmE n=1 Tax=Aquabacterium sp. TaxID=1872578 RepID=UPI002B946C52|nr:tRNA uridine-5-carboxymethylaminomethyl(34) synthesis GTPase MnmE [Aquabacterium sp.]HSW04708.1 tRNA uridine-5-carboxymethylaminomethyl(34) synthesis GTPase MnmE [Aquabacterium sp.]